jgi:hypothetical protein
MSRIKTMRGRTAAFIAAALGAAFIASSALADEGKDKLELGEPFFSEKPAVEREIEFGAKLDGFNKKRTLEFSAGLSWTFTEDWQVGVEVPFGVVLPTNGGKDRYSLSDVEFSTKYVLLRSVDGDFLLSLAGDVAPPTGSRSKGIGGTGEWGVSLLASTGIPLGDGLVLGLFGQVGYESQIRVSRDAREEAEEMEIGPRREKEFVFRAAATLPLADGKFVPTFEVIGTRILDATNPAEQGTIVEIGGGFWWSPFEGDLEGLSIGVAAKGPVTSRKEGNYTILFVAKFELE